MTTPTEKPNGKNSKKEAKAEPKTEAKADTAADQADAAELKRKEAIRDNARALYKTIIESADFSKDSFIELGESVRARKPWDQLHPAVMKCLMRIGRDLKLEPIPDAPAGN